MVVCKRQCTTVSISINLLAKLDFSSVHLNKKMNIILFSDGSRTPYYGSLTPSHSDGGRTPSGIGAWDPTVSNTPARNSEYDLAEEEDDNERGGSSPLYSQHSNSVCGTEHSYGTDHPSRSPPINITMTPSSSERGFPSPNYTPSSPTNSNVSMMTGITIFRMI